MTGDFATDLLQLQDRNFTDQWDALVEAQEFANAHGVTLYVLVDDERGGYWVSDRAEGEVADEAIPDA
jgi:hypothetical protein